MAIDQDVLENLDNLSPEEAIEVAKAVAEEYKTLQSSTSKGMSIVDQAITFYKESWSDIERLEELQSEHPEVAKVVLKKFYDGKTMDEIKTSKEDTIKQQEAVRTKEQVDARLEHYLQQLPEEAREKVQTEYNDLVEWKTLDIEKVDKYMKLAIKSIKPELEETVEKARLASAGGANNTPTTPDTKSDKNYKASLDILKEMWTF